MEKSQLPVSAAEVVTVRSATSGEVARYLWQLEEQGLHLASASASVLHEHYTITADKRVVGVIQLYAGHAPPGTIGVASIVFERGGGYFTRGYNALCMPWARRYQEVSAAQFIMGKPNLWDHPRIESGAAADNVAARRSLERLGFKLEGIQRSWYPMPHERKDLAMYSFIPGVD